MTQPLIGTCGTCRFWEAPGAIPAGRVGTETPNPGRCHFSAPVLVAQAGVQTVWPRTLPSDWCGQFVEATPAVITA